ncbi:MAG TPA: hypothetical protein VJ721_06055 [Chthoniobacterales bacterium]|nr:hypothetical protein [Chthoniobacterales bacterium]
MKWLTGGLTFANFATVFGLLLGMIAGLGPVSSTAAIILAAGVAAVAWAATIDSAPEVDTEKGTGRYRNLATWFVAAIFAIFALRSFIWLLYVDGTDLKIQSPVNLGDLGLHLTHIQFFANGVKLWPSNPIYVGTEHLRYPAGIDLFNALLLKTGVSLIPGLVWVGLLASLATFYAFYRWGGAFAVAGFLLNGGIAGFQFLKNLEVNDYQDVNHVAWKCIPLTMFVTQRGLLYAIPVGVLLLWHWRQKFYPKVEPQNARGPLPFWVELSFYASMPLFHIHTFMALSILLVCLFIAGDPKIRGHVLVLILSALLPATFFVFLTTDYFHAHSVLEFHWGWVQNDGDFKMPFFRFWFFNFGILVPLVLTLVGIVALNAAKSHSSRRLEVFSAIGLATVILASWCLWSNGFRWLALLFLVLGLIILFGSAALIGLSGYSWDAKLEEGPAFVFGASAIFVFALFVKTAPWGWDNLKIMVWAYFIVLPYLWRDLILQWERPIRWAVCFALFASGFVSLFGGLAAGKGGFGFANRGEVDAVSAATRPMPLEARFAAWPTYNHPLLLSGRKVVMGYPGHLWTQGFDDYGKTNDVLTQLMQGAPNWRDIARTLHVRYIFWGNEEKTNYAASTRPWEKTAAIAASGTWGAIYDLDKPAVPNQTPPPIPSE